MGSVSPLLLSTHRMSLLVFLVAESPCLHVSDVRVIAPCESAGLRSHAFDVCILELAAGIARSSCGCSRDGTLSPPSLLTMPGRSGPERLGQCWRIVGAEGAPSFRPLEP